MTRLATCPRCDTLPPVAGQSVNRCEACGWTIGDPIGLVESTQTPPVASRSAEEGQALPDTHPEDSRPSERILERREDGDVVALTLPWDALASSNLRQRYSRGSDRRPWAKYKAAREAIRAHARQQLGTPWPRFPDEPVRISVRFWEPNNLRRDNANMLKAIMDGLQDAVYADDAQVVAGAWTDEGVDADNARAEVTVEVV